MKSLLAGCVDVWGSTGWEMWAIVVNLQLKWAPGDQQLQGGDSSWVHGTDDPDLWVCPARVWVPACFPAGWLWTPYEASFFACG